MSAPALRPSVWNWLYNHNPFYAISAVLMLYSVRAAYGTLEIGTINCWIMMGVLAAYTLVLAVTGVLIVRWGKVWEDARSILLLLLLLFLAVSISADDLFVNMSSRPGGTALLLCGYLFTAIVSEAMLLGTGIRLGLRYRVPYHLMMALFYVTPWWYTPELHPRSAADMESILLLFPVAAAVLFLCLIPAVRRGPAYVADNGSPWQWPWFPWTVFGVIAAAVSLRSYVLCMTYGASGYIWSFTSWNNSAGILGIVFDTIWGPYFLVPLGLAILLLLLEAGLVTRNRRFLIGVIKTAPVLILLALPWSSGPVFQKFLATVVDTIGSPLWLTSWLLIGFYGWAWLRRVPLAGRGVLITLAALSVVGPETIDWHTLAGPHPWPFLIIGTVLFAHGIRIRSSQICAAAVVASTIGLWLLLPHIPDTTLAGYRMSICYHVLWLAFLTLGLVYRDPFAAVLRAVGAMQIPIASLVVTTSTRVAEIDPIWRLSYVALLTVFCLIIAKLWHSQWYLYAFAATLAVGGYAGTVVGFRRAVEALGRPAMTAFAWSMGTLLLGFLISAHKAQWLPKRFLPRWKNGNGSQQPATSDPPPNGLSSEPTSS